MAQNIIKDLKEGFLQCSLCKDRLKKPMMLPCLHSFCFHCLKKYDNMGQHNELPCPTCRRPVYLRDDGVEGLPSNVYLSSLMERLDLVEKMTKETSSKCDFCRGRTGLLLCLDCQLHICSTCDKVHTRIPGTEDHVIISAKQVSDVEHLKKVISSQTPRCNKHTKEKLRFYCTNCSQLICRDCMVVSHQGHECVEAESRASAVKKKLEELLTNSEEKVERNIKLSDGLKMSVRALEAEATKLEKLVDAQYDKCIEKLKCDREILRSKIEHSKNRKLQQLQKRTEEASDWLTAMRNTQGVTRRILEGKSLWDTLQMEKNLARSFEKLRREQDFSGLLDEDEYSSDDDDDDKDSSEYENDDSCEEDDHERDGKDVGIGIKFIPSNIEPQRSLGEMLHCRGAELDANDLDWRNKNHIGKIAIYNAKASTNRRPGIGRFTANYEPLRFFKRGESTTNVYESLKIGHDHTKLMGLAE